MLEDLETKIKDEIQNKQDAGINLENYICVLNYDYFKRGTYYICNIPIAFSPLVKEDFILMTKEEYESLHNNYE